MIPSSSIHLSPVGPTDAAALLAFELENRPFFEAHINARPASFYSAAGVAAAIEAACADAHEDRGYQFLIKDQADAILGRINLSRVRRAHFHSAELGYRIGQSACRQGHAREALRQLLALAFGELELRRLEAVTRPENVGSQRVLLSHGFVQFGRSTRSFELKGCWHDSLYFERHAPC
jgi:[ribosomal protein S5]-alanine N-acetyltransferase